MIDARDLKLPCDGSRLVSEFKPLPASMTPVPLTDSMFAELLVEPSHLENVDPMDVADLPLQVALLTMTVRELYYERRRNGGKCGDGA